ncbi:unnamed protein product, partial [Symbiodinium microadriaticum]
RRESGLRKQKSKITQSSTSTTSPLGSGGPPGIPSQHYDARGNLGEEKDEEEEDIPEDLTHLPPDEQQRRIKKRAFGMLLGGTVLLLLFTDPMVDALNELGVRTV